jgi:hypothetical protein
MQVAASAPLRRKIESGCQCRRRSHRLQERPAPNVKVIAEMFTLAPGNKDHQVAIRCAVGVFAPLITLVLLDRLDLAIFASFGASPGSTAGMNHMANASRFSSGRVC